MPYLPENRQLLEAFREGDRTALGEVYSHYVPALMEFLRNGFAFSSRGQQCFFHGFRSAFDLENGLQEIFLRAFQERARLSYDGLRPYVNYIFGVARNYVIDEHRRRDATLYTLLPTTEQSVDAVRAVGDVSPDNPEIAQEEREVQALLAQFLAQCGEKVRLYYRLRYEEGLTQNEVGVRMELTRIQIRRIESRFKRELLAHMKSQGYLSAYGGGGLVTLTFMILGLLGFVLFHARSLP